jgi:hypothetical protein
MEVGNRDNGVGLHATKEKERPLSSLSDRGWSVRRKSWLSPNGFGLLTATPGER